MTFTPTLLEDEGSEIICRAELPHHWGLAERSTGILHMSVKPDVPQPIRLSITTAGDMVASIRVCSFHPEDLTLRWTYGDPRRKRPSQETVSRNPDGTFTASSRCTIPGSLFENPQFTVRVTWKHPAMEKDDHREVSTADPDFPWRPRITNLTPLIVQKHQESRVTCTISGYFSEKLRVSWLEKKGRTVSDCRHGYTIPAIQHTKMADNSYRCSPSLSFTPSSVTEDLEIICRVEHPGLQQPVTLSTGPPMVKVAPQMAGKVTLTPSGPDRVLCTLRLVKFYPENIEISWTFREENPKSLPSTKKIIRTNDEKTLDVTSECDVSWERLVQSGVRVTWNHVSLPRPESTELSLSDYPWKPLLGDIVRPLLVVNTECTLQCNISGYFPAELTISWHKKRKGDEQTLANGERYKILCSRPQRQPDNTHSCTARMTFTPTLLEDEGSEIICRARFPHHRGLAERSTGVLHMSDFLARPEIEMIKMPTLFLQEETQLQCRISRFYPDQLTVIWLKKENGKEKISEMPTRRESRTSDRRSEQQPDKTFSYTALQPITPSLEDEGSQLLCRVQHPSLKHPLEISTAPIQIIAAPRLIEPVRFSLGDSGEVLCSLILRSFFPQRMDITWRTGRTPEIKSHTSVTPNQDGTFTATSVCALPRAAQFPVYVRWRHLSGTQGTELRITDLPWRPHIGALKTSCLPRSTQCTISGYFPAELTVSWYKKEEGLDTILPVDYKYVVVTSTHERQPDNTYSCTASLTFPPTLPEEPRLELICRVQHPSLEHPIERGSGPMYIMEEQRAGSSADKTQENPTTALPNRSHTAPRKPISQRTTVTSMGAHQT